MQFTLVVAHYMSGDPRSALQYADRCIRHWRRLPLPPPKLYGVMSLGGSVQIELGELRLAAQRWAALLDEARQHHDLMTSFWLHVHPARFVVLYAANDRGAEAILARQEELRTSHPSFKLLVWAHALCRAETELYWGQPRVALRLCERDWPRLLEVGYPVLRDMARLQRARTSLAAATLLAEGVARVRLLRRVASDARALRRSERPLVRGCVHLLRASLELLQGRRASALRSLAAASAILEAFGIKLFAASARYCMGMLLDNREGDVQRADATSAMTEEGIVEPRRWVAWTVPGFRALLEPLDG